MRPSEMPVLLREDRHPPDSRMSRYAKGASKQDMRPGRDDLRGRSPQTSHAHVDRFKKRSRRAEYIRSTASPRWSPGKFRRRHDRKVLRSCNAARSLILMLRDQVNSGAEDRRAGKPQQRNRVVHRVKCLHDDRMLLAEYFSFVAGVTAVLCALALAADAKR